METRAFNIFPPPFLSMVSIAGAPPAASTFGGAEFGKKAGSSPSNGVAATSPWRVLSAEARWNHPLEQTWSSTLRCRSCPIWSRATLREFSSVRPAGLGFGPGGTMLESIRVTGTHYFRGINNLQQPWNSWIGRKKHELKPNNPTEEGLASIHSVLFRKDPFLWRAALLYYTVYQASQMSFCELFKDIGRFVKDPNTRWDYCVRAKRGWTDTSQPGCFSKDQVYLDGILQILRFRESIDFHLLTALGKVSYEDVDRLKELAVTENMRVPHFLHDHSRYMEHLEKIMEVNELTDAELKHLI
ncbi:putative tyrosine carboxypeptidase MATCAP2 isoform X16 [Rattus norvegicus]|uniref:putative tyrosine carboxypeptidase MATCAP2 isoform X16 n=1 Tax=Rattus norvegicus TaxID=10116 RepID=UPI002FD840E5